MRMNSRIHAGWSGHARAETICPSMTAALSMNSVSLELGGKSPNIVFEDASPEAVAGAANAIFFNHGQCCVAGSRLFVQQGRFDEVIEGVAQIAKSITLGPGMDPGTQMGPLV
jgi:phenylacetaldehyde dehydrogenase